MKEKLLVLDDDSFLTQSISDYLKVEGFTVKAMNNSSNIIQYIEINKPDLIIADIMMPDLNGHDLVVEIRKNNALSKIPVIFLTAKGMTSDRIAGYNLGCNAYIAKPFAPEELLAIVKNTLKNLALVSSKKQEDKGGALPVREYSKEGEEATLKNLTSREYSIISLVSKGFMNKEIAHKLNVSLRNVEKYVSQLLQKTDTRNRTELAKLVLLADLRREKGE